MSATQAELVERVNVLLGNNRLGQALEHQDKVRIESGYSEIYEFLKEIGQATWIFSGGSVPTALVPHVAAMVAFNCMDDFAVSNERAQRIALRNNAALPNIKLLNNEQYESVDEVEDF